MKRTKTPEISAKFEKSFVSEKNFLVIHSAKRLGKSGFQSIYLYDRLGGFKYIMGHKLANNIYIYFSRGGEGRGVEAIYLYDRLGGFIMSTR